MFENLLSVGGLSLDRLKNFVEVAEKGAIARVADGDPSRQSLISRQISELEAFFGTELTRRKGKGLELTEAGRELARQARLQFQGLADFKASCSGKPVEFRIASGNSVLEWLVAPDMRQIAASVPGSTFALLDWRTGDVVRGLLDHTVDFGIIRKSALVKPLKFLPIGRISYKLFVPKTMEGTGKTSPSLPLAISVGGEFLQAIERANSGLLPNIRYRCTSFTQAAQLVRSGVAAAILPHTATASLSGQAVVKSLPWIKDISRDLGLAWHQRLIDVRPQADKLLGALEKFLSRRLNAT